MACNHDYIQPGTKVTCIDPCRLKKADPRFPNRECLTVGKQYTCTGKSSNGQTFSVKDDAGLTRSFKCYGDKYFETARKPTGSFGACGALAASSCSSNCSDSTDDAEGGTIPLTQFFCKIGEDAALVVDCAAGTCSTAIAGPGGCGAPVCTNKISQSSRCGTVATNERNKCAPLCPGA